MRLASYVSGDLIPLPLSGSVRNYPMLQNSKVAAVESFGENLKHEKIDDSYSLRGATELTYEFGARE